MDGLIRLEPSLHSLSLYARAQYSIVYSIKDVLLVPLSVASPRRASHGFHHQDLPTELRTERVRHACLLLEKHTATCSMIGPYPALTSESLTLQITWERRCGQPYI